MTDAERLAELKTRLSNPAVPDEELATYLTMAKRDVSTAHYSASDYDAQLIDTACVYLADDNKFPEIASINQGGVSTSFASNDPERFRKRIAGRREASWMAAGN